MGAERKVSDSNADGPRSSTLPGFQPGAPQPMRPDLPCDGGGQKNRTPGREAPLAFDTSCRPPQRCPPRSCTASERADGLGFEPRGRLEGGHLLSREARSTGLRHPSSLVGVPGRSRSGDLPLRRRLRYLCATGTRLQESSNPRRRHRVGGPHGDPHSPARAPCRY